MEESDKKPRKNFPEWIVDQIMIDQDGVCATEKCFNPLVNGFHRHHKDKDHSNIAKENCELKCLECHFKTFGDKNPLEAHRVLQRTMMVGIANAMKAAIQGTMTGSTLERVLGGYAQAEKLSWKEKGLNLSIEYPSATFTMLRQMQKQEIIQEAIMEGFREGIKFGMVAYADELKKLMKVKVPGVN